MRTTQPVEIYRRPMVEVRTPAGQFLFAVPHVPSIDRLSLPGLLLLSLTIRAGVWHQLKTYADEDSAVRVGLLLEATSAYVECFVVERALYARVVDAA